VSSRYTAVPGVIDALEALWSTAVVGDADVVHVSDGYPGPTYANDIVAIGGTSSNTEEGESRPAGLGIAVIEEDFNVHCAISCYRGAATDPSDQKVARDAAYALLDRCLDAVYANVGLNGACVWAIFDRHALKQSDQNDATNGRAAEIEFTLRVYSRLQIL
jgi:hypothetical protein